MKTDIKHQLLILIKLFQLTFTFCFCYLLSAPFANAAEDQVQLPTCPASNAYEVKLLPASKIIYLRVDSMCPEATKEIGKLLRDYFSNNPKELTGAVLDLRKTGFGYLSTLSGISSIFLPPNFAIDSFVDKGKTYPVRTGKFYYQKDQAAPDYLDGIPESLRSVPLAVLVSTDTKYSGDSLANGLLVFRKAILVGEEFDSGFSDDSTINNIFHQEIIKNFPIANSSHPNIESKQYLSSSYIPKGCSWSVTDKWKNKIINAILKNAKYPPESIKRKEGGYGVARVLINVNGKIEKNEIEDTTGSKYLDKAILDMISKVQTIPLDCATQAESLNFINFRIPMDFQPY